MRVEGEDEGRDGRDARRMKTFLDGRLDSLPGYPIRRERRYVRRRRVPGLMHVDNVARMPHLAAEPFELYP